MVKEVLENERFESLIVHTADVAIVGVPSW